VSYAKRGSSNVAAARVAASSIIALYYNVYELLPPSPRYAGESFGIHRMLGAWYALDDVPAEDVAAIEELERELQAACDEIGRGV
jgi:hypothetical protein